MSIKSNICQFLYIVIHITWILSMTALILVSDSFEVWVLTTMVCLLTCFLGILEKRLFYQEKEFPELIKILSIKYQNKEIPLVKPLYLSVHYIIPHNVWEIKSTNFPGLIIWNSSLKKASSEIQSYLEEIYKRLFIEKTPVSPLDKKMFQALSSYLTETNDENRISPEEMDTKGLTYAHVGPTWKTSKRV